MVGADLGIYNHVGTVERLEETVEMLSSRFGYPLADSLAQQVPLGERNQSRYSETVELNAPYRALPAELDALENGFPMPELFYTPELTQLVQKCYAADVELHAAALRGR